MRRPCADREEKRVTRGSAHPARKQEQLDLDGPNQRGLLAPARCRRALASRQTVHLPDISLNSFYARQRRRQVRRISQPSSRSAFARRDPDWGLDDRPAEPGPFTQKQIELVTTFADQAVIAIENTRLFEEVQARTRELSAALEQQTATSEVLEVISSSPGELEPVFEAMLEKATRFCGAQFGNLFLREGQRFRAVAMHGPAKYVELWRREPTIDFANTRSFRLPRG